MGGAYVLTNSKDNVLTIWDMRPFYTGEKCVKVLTSHKHNYDQNMLQCSWSLDGALVTAGSSHRNVFVQDTATRHQDNPIEAIRPHGELVNDVDFHSLEPFVMRMGSSKQIYF